jgi:DNA-binding PadR family transcriptional regulator
MRNFTLDETLTNKTLHGYGVRSQVAHDSVSNIIMAPGTTYAILKRLVSQRLLESVASDQPNIACRYRLTSYGRQRLQSEITRLEQIISRAHFKLGRTFAVR